MLSKNKKLNQPKSTRFFSRGGIWKLPKGGDQDAKKSFVPGEANRRKKCYNKVLDQASKVAAYGGRADPSPNILLLGVIDRIFTAGLRG